MNKKSVGAVGLEPTQIAPYAPEAYASTSFATNPKKIKIIWNPLALSKGYAYKNNINQKQNQAFPAVHLFSASIEKNKKQKYDW